MKRPQLIYDIVCAVRESCDLPVSVKIRKGWDDNSANAVEVAKLAEKAGVSHITIHGRTVKQEYRGSADYSIIKDVVKSVNVPVIGNGDIKNPFDAENMINITGCDAIMIGRGILGNPFLFKNVKHYLDYKEILPNPTQEEIIDTALMHIKKIIEYKGEYVGIREARKHAIWYIKGMKNSVAVKSKLTAATSFVEMEGLLTSLIDI